MKRSLYVKLKDWMSNSVDPDDHMSRLIWIYAVCKSLLLLLVAVKELIIKLHKENFYTNMLPWPRYRRSVPTRDELKSCEWKHPDIIKWFSKRTNEWMEEQVQSIMALGVYTCPTALQL